MDAMGHIPNTVVIVPHYATVDGWDSDFSRSRQSLDEWTKKKPKTNLGFACSKLGKKVPVLFSQMVV